MSRSPIDGFDHSNGHGRRQPGLEVVSRQSNLIVTSTRTVSDEKLRQMLIDEIKRRTSPTGSTSRTSPAASPPRSAPACRRSKWFR